jgi:hypothetical protein
VVAGGVRAQAGRPLFEHRFCRLVQALQLLGGQSAGDRKGRQPRTVQDLVGIGVADAAHCVRIGERFFQCAVLARERSSKRGRVAPQGLDATRTQSQHRTAPLHEVQRSAPLCARFGERERARIFELKLREHVFGWQLFGFGPEALPVQAARDHQMDHEKILAFQRDHHPLAQALDALNPSAPCAVDRRHGRAQQERALQRDLCECAGPHLGLQALGIDRDVRQLRHGPRIILPHARHSKRSAPSPHLRHHFPP